MKNSSKKPLVFLSGWGFKASIWKNISHAFKDHPMALLDLPQLTEKTASTSLQLDFIVQQLQKNIPPHATLIAWSLGGLFAMQLCHQYPHHYQQLVLTNTTPAFSAALHWPGIALSKQRRFMHDMHHRSDELRKKFIKTVQYPQSDDDRDRYLLQHIWHDDTDHFIHYLRLLFSLDLREIYSQLTLPITQVFGAQDAIVPIDVASSLKKLNASANLHVLQEAGHAPFLSHPAHFTRIIQAVL